MTTRAWVVECSHIDEMQRFSCMGRRFLQIVKRNQVILTTYVDSDAERFWVFGLQVIPLCNFRYSRTLAGLLCKR